MKFKKIEIEVSSKCNAACPGCKRVDLLRKKLPFDQINIDPEVLYNSFKNIELEGTEIYLCGVLGDPILHQDLIPIAKYFLSKKSKVTISTNGSLRSKSFWQELGSISKENNLEVKFAVDGLEDTNHIYRVNTEWKKILENMQTFSQAGGKGNWVFISFNYNQHQVDQAKSLSDSLNFKFSLRQSIRNSDQYYVTETTQLQKNKTLEDQYTIKAANESIVHPFLEEYRKIQEAKKIYDISKIGKSGKYENRKAIPLDFIQNPDNQIVCKYIHEDEIFISSNGRLWPCCFLWDEYLRYNEFYEMSNREFGILWNDLNNFSLLDILDHEYYSQILEESWKLNQKYHTARCWLSCGVKGQFRNQIKVMN
jgi:MoaA/NifB/PqqE/SkfB family radical SAM enzyme